MLINGNIILKQFKIFIFIFLGGLSVASCDNQAVLSHLINTRMQLILKGTYETNNPHEWSEIYQNDSLSSQSSSINQPIDIKKFNFYFDFANIGLSTLNKQASETIDSDWSFFFRERMVLCPRSVAEDGTNLKTCQLKNGIQNLNNFFKEGLTLKTDDIAEGSYQTLSFYLRNILTSPSNRYNSLNKIIDPLNFFDNKNIKGVNISNFYEYTLKDDTSKQDSRIVPLIDKNLNINIDASERPYTLEIRIFLKNLMMNHIWFDTQSKERLVFIGPSDWLMNHTFDDHKEAIFGDKKQKPENYYRLGGNILISTRKYFNDERSNLLITKRGTVCLGGPGETHGLSYFAVLPSGVSFKTDKLPFAATKYQSSTEEINNLPPGSYDLYITQDRLMNTQFGVESGKDGFPESFRLCKKEIIVSASSTVDLDISTCSCPL